jgi:NAD(P)-dependent dehydrogenase (short-subunit alcohol dehydrogenase family)
MTATRPVALVTGASSGIGNAAALALIEAGFNVVGTSRDTSRVTPGNGVTFLDLDVTDHESVTGVVQQVVERFGRIDVLVNNAGIGAAGAAEESSLAQDQRLFDVNVFGLIRMTKAVLPHMRTQGGGRIINISSVLGFLPGPLHGQLRRDQARGRGLLRVPGPRGPRARRPGPAHPARLHQHRVRGEQPTGRQPAAALRPAAAHLRRPDGGDDPAVVAKVVVAAATDPKPRLRYAAGPYAGRVRTLRRIVPSAAFDKQIRKLNRLAG